ncbi:MULTISPECIES: YciI family protein [Paenibacillus]|uniref:YCII-related domain-containing protein n=1 Tax=Paenibacillus germinis TaxID=2654979 RepID=A0ABX1YXF8_9BACL|nr:MULTISPECIES: YciI family protein [Paenibacillus]MDQ0898689.1 uncharacterized protein YciI [Paenibacillus sp. V4I7]MDQ0915318.1 uncharacterized protein YciI [Paenibacillus sp. V4I5]NOU85815.1 hypothetical protein [Paenibacillus germinis]
MSDNKEFIYVLRLKPAFLDRSVWTEKEDKIVEEHFQYLLQLKEEGELILAGRTQTFDEKTFGIVILRVDNELEATLIMEQDPAVANQLMTSELFPYSIAVM